MKIRRQTYDREQLTLANDCQEESMRIQVEAEGAERKSGWFKELHCRTKPIHHGQRALASTWEVHRSVISDTANHGGGKSSVNNFITGVKSEADWLAGLS